MLTIYAGRQNSLTSEKILVKYQPNFDIGFDLPTVLNQNPLFLTSSFGFQVLEIDYITTATVALADVRVSLVDPAVPATVLQFCRGLNNLLISQSTGPVTNVYRYTCRLESMQIWQLIRDYWTTATNRIYHGERLF